MNSVLLACPLRIWHRTSALILMAFLAIHILNHAVGLSGQAQHVAFMAAARPYYRNPIVEPILLALFALQAFSGVTLVVRGWRARSGIVAWLQAISGLYLAAFVVIHAVSVLSGRIVLGLDTDFRFAAAGFHVAGWPWYFAPYYFLAVASLFLHIGCALYWNLGGPLRDRARLALGATAFAGTALSLAIVGSLAGYFYPVVVPQSYLSTYTAQ